MDIIDTIFDKIVRNLNRRSLSRIIVSRSFHFFEKYLNLHITPVHYYSPIPNVSELGPKIFEKIYDDRGLDWNVSGQMDYLHSIFAKYSSEFTPSVNPGLTLVDSYILYAMIREKKPKMMIEVGGGESTKISLQAFEKNEQEGLKYKFYAIEPYPKEFIRTISKENFKLIEKKLQDVDIDFLATADLFFIDSSHVEKIGSDVNYGILEIVPKLKKGAIIHWHDIIMPTNYWKDWTYKGTMFWNESYMLHSFMLFNNTFKIIWGSRYMQLNHSEAIKKQFPYFQPQKHRLTYFWVQRVR